MTNPFHMMSNEEILARLDSIIAELTELRNKIIGNEAPDESISTGASCRLGDIYDKDFSEGTKEPKQLSLEELEGQYTQKQEEETEEETDSGSLFDLGSSSELFFDSDEDHDIDDFIESLQEKSDTPTPSPAPAVDAEEAEKALVDSFILAGSADAMEQSFEQMVHFNLVDRLTLADRYLFANELFMGDVAELNNVLTEIEQMSSVSQAEDYLYHTIGLDPENDEVKRFVAFVQGGGIPK